MKMLLGYKVDLRCLMRTTLEKVISCLRHKLVVYLGGIFTPVPNFTKKIRHTVGSGFLTTVILEDSKITLLIHSPILVLHDVCQNHRWKVGQD